MASGAFWSLVGSVLSRGFALIAGIVVARFLGKVGYGQLGLIYSSVGMFAQFAGIGVAATASKHIAELRTIDADRAGRVLSLIMLLGAISVLLMALALLGTSHWLAYTVYRVPELFVPLMLSSLMVFCIVTTRMSQGVLRGFEDFRYIAVTNVVQGLSILLLVLVFISWLGLSGAVIATAISYGLSLAFTWWFIFKRCREHRIRLRTHNIWEERKILWQYSAPSFVMSSMIGPATMISQAFVARIPGGLAGLGGYLAAARWQAIVSFVPIAVSRVFVPTLSKLMGQKEYARLRKVLLISLKANTGLALIIGLPIAVLSPWILSLYGVEFRQDWDIMVMLIGVGVLEAANAAIAPVTTVMNKMWWRAGIHLTWAVVLVGGSYFGVSKYGVRGYVWALLGTKVIMVALYSIIVIHCLRQLNKKKFD